MIRDVSSLVASIVAFGIGACGCNSIVGLDDPREGTELAGSAGEISGAAGSGDVATSGRSGMENGASAGSAGDVLLGGEGGDQEGTTGGATGAGRGGDGQGAAGKGGASGLSGSTSEGGQPQLDGAAGGSGTEPAVGGGPGGSTSQSGAAGEAGSAVGGGTGGNGQTGGDSQTGEGGASGAAGASGNGGTSGAAGAGGNGGTSGAAGAGGEGGASGAAGASGNGGASGAAGASGNGGASGAAGASGNGGASGAAGAGGEGGTVNPCGDGCFIEGDCRPASTPNPAEPCEICEPTTSATAWTPTSGNSCSDEMFCNGTDACLNGLCVHSDDACAAGVECRESDDTCCTPEYAQACGEDASIHYFDACGNIGELVQDCPGDCVDGACRCIIYVNGIEGNDDSNSGTSWNVAKQSVQAGIDAAEAAGGCEVWVREGSYRVGSTRESTLLLRTGVAVFGGFVGSELAREARNITGHETTLTGDTTPSPPDTTANVYHVVTGATGAALDGFTVTRGNADGDGTAEPDCGGGFRADGQSPTIRSCKFLENYASLGGSALCSIGGAPVVESCTFRANQGSAVRIDTGEVSIASSLFEENDTVDMGAAIFVAAGSTTVRESRFSDNVATVGGAAVYLGSSVSALFGGCQFRDNHTVTGSGGAILGSEATLTVVESEFTGNAANSAAAASNNSKGGAISLSNGSAYIASSIFDGNRSAGSSGGEGGAIQGFRSLLTIGSSVFANNSAAGGSVGGGRGGALNVSGGGAEIANCTFFANEAEEGGLIAPGWQGGAVHTSGEAGCTIRNSVLFGNLASAGPDVYEATANTVLVGYSLVHPPYNSDPVGTCIEGDPLLDLDFVPDNDECIDAGDSSYLPPDSADLDEDGNVSEPIPFDVYGAIRVQGDGLDMGAVEVR